MLLARQFYLADGQEFAEKHTGFAVENYYEFFLRRFNTQEEKKTGGRKNKPTGRKNEPAGKIRPG